jgi:chromosome segregation ATPase
MSFAILSMTGSSNEFIIFPETTVSFFEARDTEMNDQLYVFQQEKTEAKNMYQELEARKAELEARNAELEARNAELEEKLKEKDKFILEYWETMKDKLIAEKKQKKELEDRNADLVRELDWYHKQCSRQRSCTTELPALSW